jgi:predicted Zn finger-like uncharacterized protein
MFYACDNCKARLKVPEEKLRPEGIRLKCPKCGSVLLVKKPAAETAKLAKAAPVKPLGAVKRGKRINPHLFTFPFWGGLIAIMAGGIIQGVGSDAGGIVVLAGLAGIVFGLIYHLIALYRCWYIIPSSIARTTPGKAVGLLFVPFFNLYWIFVAVRGLAVDANEFMDRTVVSEKRISEGLSITYCILAIMSIIIFFAFFAFIMLNILVYQWARFNNDVVAAPAAAFQKPPQPYRQVQRKTNEATVVAIVIGVIVAGMVAVAIMGILAAIAIPAFLGQREKARMRFIEATAKGAVLEAQDMLDAYAAGEPYIILGADGVEDCVQSSTASSDKTCTAVYGMPNDSTYSRVSDVVDDIIDEHKGKGEKNVYTGQDLFTSSGTAEGSIVLTASGDNSITIVGYGMNGKTIYKAVVSVN